MSLWGFYYYASVHEQKQLGEARTDLAYTSISQSIIRGSRGRHSSRNLEAGTKTETMEEECCWLAPPELLTLLFITQPRTICPGWHCLQWAGSSPINHQSRKWPTDMPTGNWMETVSPLRFSSQRTLVCVMLTERTDQYKRGENKTNVRKANSNPVSISSLWGRCCQL